MSDISSVFIWWLVNLILGLMCLPLSVTLFNRFLDKGYIFSKIVGVILSSYIIWLGGSFHILPFNRILILVVILGLTIINLYLFSSKFKNLKEADLPWRWFIFEEILFLLALSAWSYVKATEPSIRGLEKFMDFGFVNSILRGNFFPPADMWLTKSPDYSGGYFINYYYFGHYITAFLTKLSGLDSTITYNLMIATLFAYTFSLSFSLGINLFYLFLKSLPVTHNLQPITHNLKLLIVGLLAGFLVAMGGNLHTLYVFTDGYPNETPAPPWTLEQGFHPEKYWYPNATRFIPFTIHEFPIYSFVVSDLHGHVSDIPMVLLTLAVLLTLILPEMNNSPGKNKSSSANGNALFRFFTDFKSHTSIPFITVAFLGMLLAIMYMTNAWDGLIYMILAGLVFLYINTRNSNGQSTLSVFYKTFSASLFLLFFFLITNLPFSFNFKPFVSGVGVLCAPKFLEGKTLGPLLFEQGKCQKSPLYMLATLWGFFYFNVIGYFLFVIIPSLRSKQDMGNGERDSEMGKWKKENLPLSRFSLQFLTSLPALLRKALQAGHFSHLTSKLQQSSPVDIFVLLLIFISTLLLIFPEFFYMKDIYPAHYRANTMFKLGYQAFMMLGLCSAYILFRIGFAQKPKINPRYIIYRFFFMILFTLVAIYPYFAITSYFGNLKTYYGLYGLNWMQTQYPDDYKGVIWLRQNINCRGSDCNNLPVIAEANGDSYTDYARVSANTGLPTIIGWPVHEWLWRGSYDEAGRRIPEVATLYESKDLAATREILKKYNVEYIFVGQLEKDKYKNLYTDKFPQLGKVVFESGGTKIYKVNNLI